MTMIELEDPLPDDCREAWYRLLGAMRLGYQPCPTDRFSLKVTLQQAKLQKKELTKCIKQMQEAIKQL